MIWALGLALTAGAVLGWFVRQALFVKQMADLDPETLAVVQADVERKLRRGTDRSAG